jgi:lysophospholipase L1-like esterase
MQSNSQPTIAFLGDSITEGVIGASYVNMVRAAFQGQAQIVNAGINGDTVVNMRRRVLRDVAVHNPDIVVVMAGLNDLGTAYAVPLQRGYYRLVKRNWLDLTPRRFAAGYRALLAELRQHTTAQIVLSTMTTISEDPDAPVQAVVDAYCTIIRAIAQQQDLALIELREAFRATIAADPRPGPTYTIHVAMNDMLAIRWRGATYQALAERRGYRLTCDGVHLAEAGAALAAGVVTRALREVVCDKMTATCYDKVTG